MLKYLIKITPPPFFFVTLSLMIGVSCAHVKISPFWIASVALAGAIYNFRSSFNNSSFYYNLFILTIISASCLWGYVSLSKKIAEKRSFTQKIKNRSLIVSGLVIDQQNQPCGNYATVLILKPVTIVTPDGNTLYTNHKAKLFFKKATGLLIGNEITVKKVFCFPEASLELERYAAKEEIALTSLIRHGHYSCLQAGPQNVFQRIRCYFSQLRYTLVEHLKSKMRPGIFSLFSSLFLGISPTHDNEFEALKNNFNQWGIAHFLARSGLHVLVMLLVWQWLLKLIPISLHSKTIILLLIIFLCTLLTWSSVSFSRAVITYGIGSFLCLSEMQKNALQIIALTCFIILAQNPLHLFFLNFQLSFGLALALAWISEISIQKKRMFASEAAL